MYGAEYEDNFFGSKLFENEVPCAVCFAPQTSVSLMIPGKTACYSGWKIEYIGKLAGGTYFHNAASEYVCLDNAPEVLGHAAKDENGKLFYAVRAKVWIASLSTIQRQCSSSMCCLYKINCVCEYAKSRRINI